MANDSLSKRFRSYDRETVDTLLLVFVFGAGVSASLTLKYFGFAVWVPALVAAGFIIFYALVAYLSRGARLEPDQVGDNAYYLGFVFTLSSLAYTLWEVGEQSSSPDLINRVISGFGIALTSTIVGVIVRVIMLQYRVDLVARENETRLRLNDAMREFQVEVQDVVRGTKYLGAEIRQSLEEHNRDMAESYEKRTENLIDELSDGFRKILDELLEQGKETNRRLAASSRHATLSASKTTEETLAAVAEEMKQAGATLNDGMRQSGDVLKITFEHAANETMATLCDGVKSSIEDFSNAHGEKIRRQLEQLEASTARMQSSTGIFAEKLEANLARIDASLEALSRHGTSALDQTNRTVREFTEALSKQSASMAKFVEEMPAGPPAPPEPDRPLEAAAPQDTAAKRGAWYDIRTYWGKGGLFV